MTEMKATVFALAATLALVAVPDGASARGPSFDEFPPTSTPWTVTRTRSADITYGANPTTTFYYNVQGSGSPALSHITFGVSEVAMANFVSGTVTGQIANPTIEVGKDPTTSMDGVKFDDGQPETATWEYAMTFDGHYAEGPIRIATKGSRFYSVQELDGPVALSEVTTAPGTPPSGPSDVCTYGANVPVNEDNIVFFGGREIATLDFSAPNGREVGCQAERLQLPEGWYLAPNEPFYRAAFGGGSGWSTDCLVMADGEGFSPKTLADCGSGLLDVAPATASCNASYGVTSCDMRVAITRNNTVVDTFIEHGDFESPSSFTGALSGSAWSDIQLPGRTVKYPVYQGTTGRNPPSNAACLDTTVLADANENIFSGLQQSSGNLAANSPLQEGFSVRGWANIEVPLSAQTTPPTTFDPDGRDFSILVDLYYTDATADYGVNAPFNSSLDNEWQFVSLDIFPRKRLSHFIVSLVFYNAHGRVCFDDISTGRISGQLVVDGGFEGPPFDGLGGIIPPAWMPELDHEEPQQLPQGPMLPPHSGQGQVCFNATTRNQKHGIAQITRLNDVNARVLYLSGWSQAINVTGNEDGLYSVYMDLQYDNGDWLYGQYASFETGTHDWQFSTTEVYPRRPVRYIYVYALFRSHKGWACFDDVTVAYGPSRGATPKLTCSSYGDPHIRTWDALDYDLQSEGEYTLTDDGQLEVQARFEAPSNVDPHATVTTAASMFYGNDTVFMNVAVYARVEENATATSGNTDPPFVIVQDPALNETGHAIIMPTTGTFALTLTDTTGREVCNWRRHTKSNNAKWTDRFDFFLTGQLVVVETYRSKFGRQYQRITVSEKSDNAGPTVGLCGNRNTEKNDEFILRGGGAALTQPLTPVQMYDEFGESWRLDNTTTNFFYLRGTSPETYHNRSWDDFYTDSPDQGLRRQPGTYTPAERAEADEVCDRGLDATLFTACVWDVLFSGDIGFAEDYPLLDQAVVVNRTTSVFPNHTEPENPTSLPVNSATPPSSPPASDETYSAASTTTTTVALAALAAAIALAAQ